MLPKFKLLYFKSLLDIAFNKFFDLYCNDFTKVGNKYVLSKQLSKRKVIQIFNAIVVDELKKMISSYDILNPQYFMIIGSCMPKDNILLKFNDAFPSKLARLLDAKYQMKYFLKENDIEIDSLKFNEACIDVFNQFFASDSVRKNFGKDYVKNVIFIQHSQLDCYTMFKVLKHLLGKENCVNLHAEHMQSTTSPIVAINDLIDKYANKKKANNSPEFKRIVAEVQTYMKELIPYCVGAV